MADNNQNADSKLVGLLAQFDDPHALVHACDNAREAGYKVMDAYSPFPVHGIDPAIGIRRTWLPFFRFVGCPGSRNGRRRFAVLYKRRLGNSWDR